MARKLEIIGVQKKIRKGRTHKEQGTAFFNRWLIKMRLQTASPNCAFDDFPPAIQLKNNIVEN